MKNILIGSLLFLFINCGSTSVNQPEQYIPVISGSNPKQDTFTLPDTSNQGDYLIFGIYCGECMGECATMYKLDVETNTLYVDHTDGFWKYKFDNEKSMDFSERITDSATIAIGKKLNRNLPAFVFSENTYEKIGCPDCTDGCGIYIETRRNNIVKKRDIDYQTSGLSGTVKKNAEYIKSIIDEL